MAKEQGLASDVVLTDLLSGVTVYICVGTVLGKQRLSLVSKNMNSEVLRWIR